MTRTPLLHLLLIVTASFAAFAPPAAARTASPSECSPSIRWESVAPDGSPAGAEQDSAAPRFELGHLTVPENRSRPEGRTIELAFVRLPSTAAEPGDPIVYLNGGPGQPATPLIRSPERLAAFDALRDLGDVILLDQRGTGRSTPSLICRWSEPPDPTVFLPSDESIADLRDRFARCVETLRDDGIDLSAFNTRESADDLEDLRRALGAERLRLLAFSYGSHLAMATIRRHGDHLGPVVAVGIEGPDHTWKLPFTFDTQVAKIARLAAADATVGPAEPDLVATLRKALDRLADQPLVVTLHDPFRDEEVQVPVGPDGFRRILLWDLGDTNDLPWFPALIHQVAHGETGLLSWFVTKRYRQVGAGLSAMNLAMDCASGVSATRRARIEAEAATSLFGDVANDIYSLWCPVLGDVDLGAVFRAPIASDVPTLFVSGTLDCKTPPFQAEELRWGFPRGQTLTVVNAGHESMLPEPEVQRAIVEFLATGRTGVSRVELPSPAFVPVDRTDR